MPAVISVDDLSKSYRLGTIGGASLREDVSRWWAKLRGRPDPFLRIGEHHDARNESGTFWALRNVSFEVRQGDVLGIVGRNGAGKSTLLKILSRVTGPTEGRIRLRGRVASLLEVGTGFHQELTGRENVFLNGAILGMTKAEIRAKFDEIVEFAEIAEFIDTPVKRYSSGMYVRLAFAVAAHLEPEILIVDEVLAVGDATFQKKCLGKMRDVAGHGRTVLFVSHNTTAVQSLCSRAVLLSEGGLVLDDTPEAVIAQHLSDGGSCGSDLRWDPPEEGPGNELLRLSSIRVGPGDGDGDGDGDGGGTITMKSPVAVETGWRVLKPGRTLHVTYHLVNEQGITVLTTWPAPAEYAVGDYRARFLIPGSLLNSGRYFLRVVIVEDGNRVVFQRDAVAAFTVADAASTGTAYHRREPGVVQPPLPWVVQPAGR